MRIGPIVRVGGLVVVFLATMFIAVVARGWLGGTEAAPSGPTPVIAPAGVGEEPPPDPGSGPVPASSHVAHTGGAVGQGGSAPGGVVLGAVPAPGVGVPAFGFEDPCAGEAAPADCPEGEPATVLGDDEDAPLAIDVVPYPYGEPDLSCVPEPAEAAWMPVLIVTNNPASLEVDYGPSFSDGSLELSTGDDGHACATLTELVEEAAEVVVRVLATDASGSEAEIVRLFTWSPSGRPPVVLQPTGDLEVEATVSQRDPEGGHTVRVRIDATCDPDDADGTEAEEVQALPAEVLADDAYPYDPDYSHRGRFLLLLEEGTDYLACVLWLDPDGGITDLEEHPLSAPDRLRVRISLDGVHGSDALGAVEVEVPGCGSTSAAGLVCDSAGHTWPTLTPLVVRHGGAEAEALLSTPTAKCLPVEALEGEHVCATERTEWIEVPIPAPGEGIGQWLCGPGIGSCEEGQGPPGVVLLKLEFYDGASNGWSPPGGLVAVGFAPEQPEKTPILDLATEGDPAGADGPMAVDGELKAGRGCEVQCIVQGHAHPRGFDAFLVVITDTPAEIFLHVHPPDGSSPIIQDSHPERLKGFGGWFEDLKPGTTYNVTVTAKDAEGFISVATGSFTTLNQHVEILFRQVHVQKHPEDRALVAVYLAEDWQPDLAHKWNDGPGRPPGPKAVSLVNPPPQFPLGVEVMNRMPPQTFAGIGDDPACSPFPQVGHSIPWDASGGALPSDYGPSHGTTRCYAYSQAWGVITVDTVPAWAPSSLEYEFHGRLDTGTGPDVVHFTFYTVTVSYS